MLSIANLSKDFKNNTIFDCASVSFYEGITGIVGLNGSGKTTLLNCIAGFTSYSGDISLNGVLLNPYSYVKRIKFGIGYLTQESNLLENETVKTNLIIAVELLFKNKICRTELIERTIDEYNLHPLLNQKCSTLSGGERKRFELSLTLLNIDTLKAVLLDEPFTGIDYENCNFVFSKIKEIKRKCIIIIDHNVDLLFKLSDNIYRVTDFKLLDIFTNKL